MWWNKTRTKNVQIPLLHLSKRISNNDTHHYVDEVTYTENIENTLSVNMYFHG